MVVGTDIGLVHASIVEPISLSAVWSSVGTLYNVTKTRTSQPLVETIGLSMAVAAPYQVSGIR